MKEDPVDDNKTGEKMIRLDCAQFEEILHELDRPGTSGAALRESALGHAEGCSRCGALVTESEALDFALGQIVDATSESQVQPKIEAALLREFRREKAKVSSRRVRWQLAILGAAATVLLVLSFVMRRPQIVVPGAGGASSASTFSAQGTSGVSTASSGTNAAANNNGQSNSSQETALDDSVNASASDADSNEYATAYVRLPYAYDPSGLEGGSVVRVVLPRAALVSYGLPIEGMGVTTDQVTADMVISEDGTPQAIRLVTQANAGSEF
jgi:hypothetical protein